MSVIYFILLLGGLVFIHELGHYLAARAVGVTVTKFSLGFGPKIVGFTRRGTEFLISAIPLGGYCKFMGDDPENPPAPEERRKGFLTTDIWRRTVIVLAGPVFNLVLPLIVFLPAGLTETKLPPAIIGSASVGGPGWEGGLRPGDRLLQIDRKPVKYWHEMLAVVSENPGRTLEFVVRRDPAEGTAGAPAQTFFTFNVTPKKVLDPTFKQLGFEKHLGRIEASLERSVPVVKLADGSQSIALGFRDFDAVKSVAGRTVWTFDDILSALRKNAGREITVVVASREGPDVPEEQSKLREIRFKVPEDPAAIGLSDGTFVIWSVERDGLAERAGFRKDDRIAAMDGRAYNDLGFMVDEMARNLDDEHVFDVMRGTERVKLTLNLTNPEWTDGSSQPKYLPLGFKTRRVTSQPDEIPNESLVGWALEQTWTRSVDVFLGTVASVAALFTGRVSVKQMGGPIMIYDLAASAGKQGVMSFLNILGWLSVSLGVLNLLPIPILDGGHLVLFVYEGIRRRPPTMKERAIWSWAGLFILALIMVIVMKNDIMRKLG